MAGPGVTRLLGAEFQARGAFGNSLRLTCNGGRSKNAWIFSNPESADTTRGTIVITMFAGCVTMPKTAAAVNVVSVSRLRPLASDVTANIASVMAGENIPRALANIR